MSYYVGDILLTDKKKDYLAHHGILGQKWGVRRYQNKDGTLTASGKERYDAASSSSGKKSSDARSSLKEIVKLQRHSDKLSDEALKYYDKASDSIYNQMDSAHKKWYEEQGKKIGMSGKDYFVDYEAQYDRVSDRAKEMNGTKKDWDDTQKRLNTELDNFSVMQRKNRISVERISKRLTDIAANYQRNGTEMSRKETKQMNRYIKKYTGVKVDSREFFKTINDELEAEKKK